MNPDLFYMTWRLEHADLLQNAERRRQARRRQATTDRTPDEHATVPGARPAKAHGSGLLLFAIRSLVSWAWLE